MKIIFQALSGLVVSVLLSSCVDKYSYFEHPPTKALLKNVSTKDFNIESAFIDREIIFVPHFRKLTDSFTVPQSFMRFYSINRKSLFIEKAVLTAGSGSFEYVFKVDQDVDFSSTDDGEEYFSAGLELFDINDVDLPKVLKETTMTLHLFYKIDGFESSMSFNLQHKMSKGIAWPT